MLPYPPSTTGGAITINGNIVGASYTAQGVGFTQATGSTITANGGGAISIAAETAPAVFDSGTLATTGSVTIPSATTVTLGTLTGIGSFSVTSTRAITESLTVPISVTGATTLNSGTAPITLTTANDDFNSVGVTGSTNTNNVTISDTNAIILAASTVGGTYSITAAGAITQSGALSITGNSTITTGAFPITLTNSSNAFTGDVLLTNTGANNVAVTNSINLSVGTSFGSQCHPTFDRSEHFPNRCYHGNWTNR